MKKGKNREPLKEDAWDEFEDFELDSASMAIMDSQMPSGTILDSDQVLKETSNQPLT